ncbi:MAG: PEP-CTERM sorting domain-containing protein [Planctomycetaceae bacterium]|jgi:hypothetical protein|nr:PEP-CTERM sorting domain-containing protein [Planctomycetaceae bacterium]
MKNKFELTIFLAVVLTYMSGVVLADISSGGADSSALGDYASEYRVDADQPENTNNCTMNSMEGAKVPDSLLEDPNDMSILAPEPFVDDVWDASNPVANDDPNIPSPGQYPGGYNNAQTTESSQPNTPEPATLLLVAAGMCGLLPFAKRKRQK